MRKFLSFFFLLQISLSFSQKTLSIEVFDSNSNPLFYANIQVLYNEDILHYGVSDKQGKKIFENIKFNTIVVKISHLGYKTTEQQIDLNEKNTYSFYLENSILELKEVVISEYPKSFKVKEDSISYNIKSVIDGTERNLGEALNKLPGLEVDEKGIVSHNGVKIDKVLVDGNDFFGNKHQMTTQNFKPEMISGIDLLKNYSDNPLEKRGSKTVLNLKLKEEYQNKFIGNVNVDLGIKNKYLNHNNLFKFSKTGNFGFISDFNNIGESPITIDDYIEMRGGIFNFIENTGGNQVTALDFNQFPKFIFSDDNFRTRNNNFVGLNYTKNKNKWKFIGYSLVNQSNFTEQIFKNRTFLNQNNLIFNENVFDKSNVFFNSTYINLKHNPNDKTYLEIKATLNPNQDKTEQNLLLYENDLEENYLTSSKNRNFNFGYDVSYQYKLNEKWNFLSQLTQNFTDNKKDMSILSSENSLFLNNNNLNQEYKFNNLKSNFNARLDYKKDKNKYSFLFDYVHDNQNLSTSILFSNFTNDIQLKNNVYSLAFNNLNYISKKLVFGFKNKINLYELNHEKNIKYEPSLSLGYNFSFSEKISFNASISNKYADVLSFNSNPIVLNYRTISLSSISNFHHLINNNVFSINYLNFNQQHEFNFFVDLSYSHNKDNVILTNTFEDNFIVNRSIISPFEDVYSGKLNFEKRFRKVPISFKTFLYVNHSKSLNFLNNNNSILTNNTIVNKTNFFSHFKKSILQIEAGYQLSETALYQSLNESESKIKNLNLFLKLKGVIKSNLIWDVKFTSIYQENILGKNNLFFISPTISIDSKNKQWTFSLLGNNILNLENNTKFVSNLSNISFDNTETAILDGYLLISIKYNF